MRTSQFKGIFQCPVNRRICEGLTAAIRAVPLPFDVLWRRAETSHGSRFAGAPSETLENRVLFSAYVLQTLAPYGSEPSTTPIAVDRNANVFLATNSEPELGFFESIIEVPHGSAVSNDVATTPSNDFASSLILDSDGNLYGTTENPHFESQDFGTVFEVPIGSTVSTVVATFDNVDGASPDSLLRDSQGNLFGTTSRGGANGDGTVFEIAHGKSSVIRLASFNGANGSNPSSLLIDSSGNLFGTLDPIFDGTNFVGNGTVFEVPHGASTATAFASFNGTNGSSPNSLVLDSAGNLFGTCGEGGDTNGDGTVFEIPHGTTSATAITLFNGANGASPFTLSIDSHGNLIGGTSSFDVTNNEQIGTVFEIAHGTSTANTLVSFNSTNGSGLNGVAVDSHGDIYGATPQGGSFEGTVFTLVPVVPTTLAFPSLLASTAAGSPLGGSAGLQVDIKDE